VCGIAGWVDWEQDLTSQHGIIEAMTETMAARGPDAFGTYRARHVLFGHRRLSVMDPANGAQPMLRRRRGGNGNCVVTYNGELYNMAELRRELEAKGYAFSTQCDTEVLLNAYIEWGPKCAERFNGIFAFAIWDEGEQSLYLARDRIGVKPLFYARRGKGIIFASELKGLLTHPDVPAEVDAAGLAEVLMLGPARTPGCGVIRGVEELKPGYWMLCTPAGTTMKQYWRLETKPHEDDFATTAATIKELLEDTVKRQLMSDVPVCTLLSGGLDSSALTALAAAHYAASGKEPLQTYAVDYRDNDKYFKADSFQPNADGPWAQRLAEHLGTAHHRVILDTGELSAALVPATWARDLPGMADVDTSLYLFCREIKKGATVALSGECADEVFGGYPWFRRPEMINAQTFPWAPYPAFRLEWLSPDAVRMTRGTEYVADRYSQALAEVPRQPGEDPIAARMREIFYLSITRFMPTLLDRKDRMSMAFGLEVRVPFCDHRIVEYVWNVPWAMKNYQEREKGLLRHALTGILPDDVLWRKKSPYPKTHDPQFVATVKSWALRILDDPNSPVLPLVNSRKLREIAASEAVMSSVVPWFGQLMTGPQIFAYLIQVDAWLRRYKIRIV